MVHDFIVPDVPEVMEQGGDVCAHAVTMGTMTYLCRDWRRSFMSRQIHPAPMWVSPYLDMRRVNWLRNVGFVVRGKGVYDLAGWGVGREAWVILAGPSVDENLGRVEIPDGDMVIGVNRGAVHYRRARGRAVDVMLLADGSITPEMCVRLWGEMPVAREWYVYNIWSHPGMVGAVPLDRIRWMRTAGLGHEMEWIGVPPEMDELEYSYNTGTMALHLSDLMGCKVIHLLGADFALTDRHFHIGEKAMWADHPDLMVAPDVDGGVTLCRRDQFIAGRKMETWAWILRHYGVRVKNETGRGTLHRWMS